MMKRVTREGVFEGVFVALVAGLFILLLVESLSWPLGAALLPRIVGIIGLPLLTIHIYNRVRSVDAAGGRAAILDTGFTQADIPRRLSQRRALRFLLSTVALFAGVWLVGFHVALPLYIFGYLVRYAEVRWWVALVWAAGFEAVLLGLYDRVINTSWNDPLLFQLLGIQR